MPSDGRHPWCHELRRANMWRVLLPPCHFCICPIWEVPRCISKREYHEGNGESILFLQTNIYICIIITWLQLAGKHLQSHIPITCPLAPHLSEQLSRGASTQVDPREEVQVPGSKWGKQLGSAAQPPRTQTPPCCSLLSRREPIIGDLLNIFCHWCRHFPPLVTSKYRLNKFIRY